MPETSTILFLSLAWTTVVLAGAACARVWPRIEPIHTLRIAWLTSSTTRVVLIPFFFSLALSAAVALVHGPPLPRAHDESSRLLQASTFRELRLTNPPHPMAEHFETFHVLHSPTYTSKYPPADAMFFAASWMLTGRPYPGAWLAIALACAGVSWMVAAWLPNRWALIAGVLTALHPMVLNWSQSYFGGGTALLGGALVIGAARRTFDAPDRRSAALGALGVALLANTRPYEGLVLTTGTFVVLSAALIRARRGRLLDVVRPLLLPVISILVVTGTWMAWYNFRVTGDPFVLPYSVYEKQYSRVPALFWQDRNDEARHMLPSEIVRFQDWQERVWRSHQSLSGFVRAARMKTWYYLQIAFNAQESHRVLWEPSRRDLSALHSIAARAFPLALAFPLVALPWLMRRDRESRLVFAGCVTFLLFMLLSVAANSHYAAPGGGLIILLITICLRRLVTAPGRFVAAAGWAIAITWAISLSGFLQPRIDSRFDAQTKLHDDITRHLESVPGKDLVIVRYEPDHNFHIEHVYNLAKIDDSEVVWARSLDSESNRELREYFDDRVVWVLYADGSPVRLERAGEADRS